MVSRPPRCVAFGRTSPSQRTAILRLRRARDRDHAPYRHVDLTTRREVGHRRLETPQRRGRSVGPTRVHSMRPRRSTTFSTTLSATVLPTGEWLSPAEMSSSMKITVIGCGYLGAVHAASMAELGHDVVGIDVD